MQLIYATKYLIVSHNISVQGIEKILLEFRPTYTHTRAEHNIQGEGIYEKVNNLYYHC